MARILAGCAWQALHVSSSVLPRSKDVKDGEILKLKNRALQAESSVWSFTPVPSPRSERTPKAPRSRSALYQDCQQADGLHGASFLTANVTAALVARVSTAEASAITSPCLVSAVFGSLMHVAMRRLRWLCVWDSCVWSR